MRKTGFKRFNTFNVFKRLGIIVCRCWCFHQSSKRKRLQGLKIFNPYKRFERIDMFKRFNTFNAFKRLEFSSADVGVFTNRQRG